MANKLVNTLLYIGLLISICAVNAQAQTPQQIAKSSFNSVVLLVMEDSTGKPVSLGSGFIVKQGIIASNFHVIEGAKRGYAKVVGQKTKYEIEGIIGADPERDLVLLKTSIKAPSSILGNSATVEIGEQVYAVGNPQGLEGTFSQGIVSSIREVGSDKLLQITAPISPGSSGGPVLNGNGEVIGISVATFKSGQNLNFAIPSNYLKILLTKTGQVKPLTQTKTLESQKSIISEMGGRSIEGVRMETLTWDSYTQSGEFSLSLYNQLQEAVKNVYCLVVFYKNSDPIDIAVVNYSGIIPGGLAKRIKGRVEGITEQLNSPPYGKFHGDDPDWRPPRYPRSRVEFRVLDFQIVD